MALVDQHTAALNAEIAEAKDAKNIKSLIQKQLTNLSPSQDFLNLYDHFNRLSHGCFHHELPFQRALKEGEIKYDLLYFDGPPLLIGIDR